jgi:hypothetical protein
LIIGICASPSGLAAVYELRMLGRPLCRVYFNHHAVRCPGKSLDADARARIRKVELPKRSFLVSALKGLNREGAIVKDIEDELLKLL